MDYAVGTCDDLAATGTIWRPWSGNGRPGPDIR